MTEVEAASLGAVLDALVAGMTTQQFDQLADRTGHRDSKAKAADAISQYTRQQNLTGEGGTASTAAAAAALRRHGRSR
jgi:hypothetical protein